MEVNIVDLPLKTRTKNCLLREGITTVDALLKTDVKTLMNIEYMGRVSVYDVIFTTAKYLYDNRIK